MVEETAAIENGSNAQAWGEPFVFIPCRQLGPEDGIGSRSGWKNTGCRIEEVGLARALQTPDGPVFASPDLPVDVLEHNFVRVVEVGDCNVPHFQDGGCANV